jgi:hypothetical protein
MRWTDAKLILDSYAIWWHDHRRASSGLPNEQKAKPIPIMKLLSTLTATLGAAVLLAAAPALASAADSQSSPIRLDNAQIFSTPSPDVDYFPGSADVAFTNENGVAATSIEFALVVNGIVLDRINDVGSFAPGVTIKHHFADSDSTPDQKIAVAKVTFADGSVWTNPDVSQAPVAPANVGIGTDEY